MQIFTILVILFLASIAGYLYELYKLREYDSDRIDNLEEAFIEMDYDGQKLHKRIQKLKKKIHGS